MLLVALMLGMSAPALAAFSARINSSSARVYKSPSTGSAYVSGGKGVTVTVNAYSGSWAQISYKGNTGYIPIQYLNLVNRIKAYTGKSTPVYAQASTGSTKLGTLSIGTGVYVVGKSGSFYRIQNASGSATGYVASGTLTTKAKLTAAYQAYTTYKAYKAAQQSAALQQAAAQQAAQQAAASLSTIDKVLLLASSLVGRPYSLYDDNPPSSFNCSSFVEYCMEKYGYSMASTAAEQAAMSNKVSKDNIQKGDVLCFDTDGNGVCDHTAIYMGSSKFIEASQSAGKVQINTLDDWYQGCLMHAIRPK